MAIKLVQELKCKRFHTLRSFVSGVGSPVAGSVFEERVFWWGLVKSKRKLPDTSVRKRPGRPADSRQAFSPARPGQSETDLGFSGQASEKPAGFIGPGGAGRLSVYSL